MNQTVLPRPDAQTVRRIADNLARVREDMAAAAHEAGRAANEIRLIAVSKTHPAERVEAARRAGQRDFGENTVQDARSKLDAFIHEDLAWHFIGHLQSNKAKYIAGQFQWLHSVDTLELAQKLEQRCQAASAALNILIQVNVTGDPAKAGVAPPALPALIESILQTQPQSLALRGLMTIGPMTQEDRALRRAFAGLRQLRDQCREQFALTDFNELSMGMSGDYHQAILEGATMVRVGSAIFGARDYTSQE